MRQDLYVLNRPKLYKFSDQNQSMKANSRANGNPLKPKPNSTWGANIVRGFTTDRKLKPISLVPGKKLPLTSSDIANQKLCRVKRSLVGDFPCSTNSAPVHPQTSKCHRTKSLRDLFLELDHVRSLLQESKERELKFQAELWEYKESKRVPELEAELDLKGKENESLIQKVRLLETEKSNISEQIASLASIGEHRDNEHPPAHYKNNVSSLKELEMEVVELRRVNKELQLQKRSLACRLSSAESQVTVLARMSKNDVLAKVEAEATILRHKNENLCKQVEGLQMSRLTEVEELVYLRWVNSCLRNELRNSENHSKHSSIDSDEDFCPKSLGGENRHIDDTNDHGRPLCQALKPESTEFGSSKRADSTKRLRDLTKNDAEYQNLECQVLLDKDWSLTHEASPQRRHSISGSNTSTEDFVLSTRRQSDGFICQNDGEREERNSGISNRHLLTAQKYELGVVRSPRFFNNRLDNNKITAQEVEKRARRIANPPPRPSDSVSSAPKEDGATTVPAPQPPPPPPPPPPPNFSMRNASVMQRVPQVVEFYHSLMKRESRKESSSGGICDATDVANAKCSMIGEIENRSSHLLAIKADVETQGEFVNSLIKEVNNAIFRDIEDVVAFVKWLDDELCFLVDERAVLKHFDWPEKKADILREAAFAYRDLKRLEGEVSRYEDDHRPPTDVALKKMVSISEKMERSVYNILRTRDGLMRHCKEFQIPYNWMLDTGIISKIKFASVKLAKKYIKRVALELQSMGASDNDPALEYMLLQGVRFAFRIHQFAGGFDAETMHAFEELRNLAHIRNKKQKEEKEK
ncbi:protein CHUP1, chloroplastic-like [Aristolochia californica]|uniref:protein CHUP1, chloroplastic-like n=1 Tax=Aristolochia californica TaxID=171875 RepID=UPI0035E12C13